jgi:hypothetical protein
LKQYFSNSVDRIEKLFNIFDPQIEYKRNSSRRNIIKVAQNTKYPIVRKMLGEIERKREKSVQLENVEN